VKESRSQEQKTVDKNLIKSIIATVFLQKEKQIKNGNRSRLPKDFLKNLFIIYQPILPTLLTTKSLENAVAIQRKKLNEELIMTTDPPAQEIQESPGCAIPIVDQKMQG
jgi:hypothetical protein